MKLRLLGRVLRETLRENAGLKDSRWFRFLRTWLLVSLVLHLLAAYFSLGFFHNDEHFQILEFLHYRIGHLNPSDLTWEFREEIRPWSQIALYALIAWPLQVLGFEDRTTWATAFRLVSALIGWVSWCGLALCCYSWFSHDRFRRLAVRVLCLLWIVPFFHARTSSENLATSAFALGLGTFWLSGPLLLSGVFLGLAVGLRYQCAFMVAGFLLWILIYRRPGLRNFALLCTGILLAIAGGLLIDSWGYQHWAWSPWNYFYQNLVLNRVAEHGLSSPSYYFVAIWKLLPPISSLLLLGTLAGWALFPRHVLTFVSLPFFLVHTAISHREERFLLPMLTASPVLCVLAYEKLAAKWPRIELIGRKVTPLLFSINGLALLVVTLKPAFAPVLLYEYLWEHRDEIRGLHYTSQRLGPLHISGIRVHYYLPDTTELSPFSGLKEFESQLASSTKPLWLFYDQMELAGELAALRDRCQLTYTVFPTWLGSFSFMQGIGRFACRWSLFRCSLPEQRQR